MKTILIIYFIGALFGTIGGFAGGYWTGVACAKRESEKGGEASEMSE
jgi:hypothetical protein